jgi:hypothetical protein
MLSGGVLIAGVLRIVQAGLWMDSYFQDVVRLMSWYNARRPLQLACIVAAALALLILLKRFLMPTRTLSLAFAIWAFYALAILAVIRISSLHWTDVALERQVGSSTLSHAAQTVLLFIISAGALLDFLLASTGNQKPLDAS